MIVTLHLKPEVEAGLLAGAKERGMNVERYVEALVEQEVSPSRPLEDKVGTARSEAVRRMLEFGDKYRLQFGEPITRESMQEGHRF